jgi:hypothetical protein
MATVWPEFDPGRPENAAGLAAVTRA